MTLVTALTTMDTGRTEKDPSQPATAGLAEASSEPAAPKSADKPQSADDASRPYDAFLSYSRADQPFARALHGALVERRKRVWADWRDIPPSAPWPAEIDEAIEGADAFVFILSPSSLASGHCRREFEHAVSHGKRVVPVAHRPVDPKVVPEALREPQWIRADGGEGFGATVATLAQTLEADLDWRRTHTRLLVRALEWQEAGGDSSLALRGGDLRRAQAELERAHGKSPTASPLQAQYVLASTRLSSRNRNLRMGAGALALVAVTVLAILALLQRDEARDQARIAVSRLLAAESEDRIRNSMDVGLALAVAAVRVEPTAEARRNLVDALQEEPRLQHVFSLHKSAVLAIAFASDGKTVTSTSADGRTLRWTTGDGAGRPFEVGRQSSAALSRDGALLASAQPDGSVTIWNTVERRLVGRFSGGRPPLAGVSVSPDASVVASTDAKGRPVLWDQLRAREIRPPEGYLGSPLVFGRGGRILGAGAELVDVRSGAVRELASGTAHKYGLAPRVMDISPDGRTLAVISANTPMIASTKRAAPLRSLSDQYGSPPIAMRYSPDGRSLLSVDEIGRLRLWNPRSGFERAAALTGQDRVNASIAFAPGSDLVAAGSTDGQIAIWDLKPEDRFAELVTYRSSFNAEFTPDGQTLLTGNGSRLRGDGVIGRIRFWDVATRRPHRSLDLESRRPVLRVAASPDGERLASVEERGTAGGFSSQAILVVNRRGGVVDRFGDRDQTDGEYEGLRFGAEGKTLIVGTSHGQLIQRDLRDRRSTSSRERHPNLCCERLMLGADGITLMSEGGDGVMAWNLRRLRAQDILPPGQNSSAVALSPTEEGIAALGSDDGRLVLWDIVGRRQVGAALRSRTTEQDYVSSLAFSADGQVLAAAEPNHGTIALWDIPSRQQIGALRKKPRGPVVQSFGEGLEFSPTGRMLAASVQFGELRLWNLDDRALAARACAIGNRGLTRGEWARFVGSASDFEEICPSASSPGAN